MGNKSKILPCFSLYVCMVCIHITIVSTNISYIWEAMSNMIICGPCVFGCLLACLFCISILIFSIFCFLLLAAYIFRTNFWSKRSLYECFFVCVKCFGTSKKMKILIKMNCIQVLLSFIFRCCCCLHLVYLSDWMNEWQTNQLTVRTN